ncbi:MAG: DUF1186 family protein [Muribaculaceae bacterium]|nr:DUF1186 family protein [Muribaculaceae bacterium]
MAKKKSGKKGAQQMKPLSPERFMREKARKLPIAGCYVNNDWQNAGEASVWVTRRRPDGNLTIASFLVDTFCLGVKDAFFRANISPEHLEVYLDDLRSSCEVEQISYDEAHNIIYGAIAFAEEGGVDPAKDFYPAGYILEEDTDDVPLIEYTFGKDGKHFLVIGEDRSEARYINTLQSKLGDNFEFVSVEGDDESYDDEFDEDDEPQDFSQVFTPEHLKQAIAKMDKWSAESARHPDEVYSYQYPEYPATLSVKHRFIADALLSPLNCTSLPRDVVERILSLPADEAAADIAAITLYVIGATYEGINDGSIERVEHSAIMHALILLAGLRSEKGLPAVLEIMRQNDDFAEVHLGDLCTEITHYAVYACGANNVQALVDYINTPGLNPFFRIQAVSALCMIVINEPERRPEIIEVLRRLLRRMVSCLPRREACDGNFAGMLMCDLVDINATELIPEIRAVYDTDCVDKTIAGSCTSVVRDIAAAKGTINRERYRLPDVYEQYRSIEQAFS